MRLILDVDTGVDDALAIALAVRHPSIKLEAVLTVVGNVSLDLTTQNTLRVLDWLGATSTPVYMGADRPLSGPVREASHWHGKDGLGGAQIPSSGRSAHEHAAPYLLDRVLAEPGELTIVCTAPLTNLALAVQHDRGIVGAVREVVLMGGTVRPPGNVTPTAEFNIYADPTAAAIVFEQSISEVTRHLFDVRRLDAMALHDPLAVAVALQPDLVTTHHKDVYVETEGVHTLGQTVVDLRPRADPPLRNTRVCTEVDVARARRLFFETLVPGAQSRIQDIA